MNLLRLHPALPEISLNFIKMSVERQNREISWMKFVANTFYFQCFTSILPLFFLHSALLYPVSSSAGPQDTKEVWFIIRPPFHVLWKPSPEECHLLTVPAYIVHTSRSVPRHWAMRTPLFILAWIKMWLFFSSLWNTLGEVIRWLSGWTFVVCLSRSFSDIVSRKDIILICLN